MKNESTREKKKAKKFELQDRLISFAVRIIKVFKLQEVNMINKKTWNLVIPWWILDIHL